MVISYNTLGGGNKKNTLKVDQPSLMYNERDCKVCHKYIILKGEYESPIQDLNPSLNPLGLTYQGPCVRAAAVVFRSEKGQRVALCTLDVGSRAHPHLHQLALPKYGFFSCWPFSLSAEDQQTRIFSDS